MKKQIITLLTFLCIGSLQAQVDCKKLWEEIQKLDQEIGDVIEEFRDGKIDLPTFMFRDFPPLQTRIKSKTELYNKHCK